MQHVLLNMAVICLLFLPVLSIMVWCLSCKLSFVLFQRREQRKQEQLSNPHYLKMSAREERKVMARTQLFNGCMGEY